VNKNSLESCLANFSRYGVAGVRFGLAGAKFGIAGASFVVAKLQFSVKALSSQQVSFCWIASPLARKFSCRQELAFKLIFLAG
jgi:hypothetical protein